MNVFLTLSAVAVKGVFTGGAGMFIGEGIAEGAADMVVGFVTQRFSDQSRKLDQALRKSNERAWQVMEVALAGDSLWRRCTAVFTKAEDRAFREQIREFLDAVGKEGQLPEGAAGPEFRAACLKELRAARKAGDFHGELKGDAEAKELAKRARQFARFSDPSKMAEGEWQAMASLADALPAGKYAKLVELLKLRTPGGGPPVLAVAARYYFRREVENDQELARGVAFDQARRLNEQQEQSIEAQRRGFEALDRALDQHGGRVAELLDDVVGMLAQTHGVVVETRSAVLDLQQELEQQGDEAREQHRDLYDAVMRLQERLDLADRRPLRPRDSMSIRTDAEREMVKLLLSRFRGLPGDKQRAMPALLNGLGMLEVAAGEFHDAQEVFKEVAQVVSEPSAEAEAHFNAYRALLEQDKWAEAFKELREAARLDPERFEPFPFRRYEPREILGAGGFGTAFLCWHRSLDGPVVVKTLSMTDAQRDADEVFAEARVLDSLNHPAIIRVRDCDYAGESSRKERPFVVMDYFPGRNLQEWVDQHGPLSLPQFYQVAKPLAEAVAAAHARGILHRDIKPSNVLVRPAEGASAAGTAPEHAPLEVKLIDFGLALKQSTVAGPGGSSTRKSLLGSSSAGTLEYAAPEQMGRMEGVSVGPYSDVYGLARTCCYALFRTANPQIRHWKSLPESLSLLLDSCLCENPKDRPATVGAVLEKLSPAARQRMAEIARGEGRAEKKEPEPRSGRTPVKPPPVPPGAPAKSREQHVPPSPRSGRPAPQRVGPPPQQAASHAPPIPLPAPPPGAPSRLERRGPGLFLFHGPYAQAVDLAAQAVRRSSFNLKSVDPARGRVLASTGFDIRSFGEDITITLRPVGDDLVEINVVSELQIGLIDFGKNKENLDLLALHLSVIAASMPPAPAQDASTAETAEESAPAAKSGRRPPPVPPRGG